MVEAHLFFLSESRCLQFDCDIANEPDIPFSAETLFGFGPSYESDVLDLTESVCLPFELGRAYAPDVPCSKNKGKDMSLAMDTEQKALEDIKANKQYR